MIYSMFSNLGKKTIKLKNKMRNIVLYKVDAILHANKGGGFVFRAKMAMQGDDDKDVILKVFTDISEGDLEIHKQKNIAQCFLDHDMIERVPTILHVGRVFMEDKLCSFMIMTRVKGKSIAEFLKTNCNNGSLSKNYESLWDQIVADLFSLVIKLNDACGMMHCDLHPENIFIEVIQDNNVYTLDKLSLIDFGLSGHTCKKDHFTSIKLPFRGMEHYNAIQKVCSKSSGYYTSLLHQYLLNPTYDNRIKTYQSSLNSDLLHFALIGAIGYNALEKPVRAQALLKFQKQGTLENVIAPMMPKKATKDDYRHNPLLVALNYIECKNNKSEESCRDKQVLPYMTDIDRNLHSPVKFPFFKNLEKIDVIKTTGDLARSYNL